jgi:hypothetical protein
MQGNANEPAYIGWVELAPVQAGMKHSCILETLHPPLDSTEATSEARRPRGTSKDDETGSSIGSGSQNSFDVRRAVVPPAGNELVRRLDHADAGRESLAIHNKTFPQKG